MKTSLIVKLNFLVLGLLLIIYFMSGLNRKGISPDVLALFGLESQRTIQSINEVGSNKLNLCEGRVRAVERPGHFKMFQKGYKWLTTSLGLDEVDHVSIDKWFGKNCTVEVEFLKPSEYDQKGFKPAFVVEFMQGNDILIKENAQGIYSWNGRPFRSAQLKEALDNLENLAGSQASNKQ